MLERLDELLERDTASRWRVISVSAIAVGVSGAVASGLAHEPIVDAQVLASVFGAIVFFAQVFVYCLRAETGMRRAAGILPRRVVLAAVSSSVLVFLDAVSAPFLEGSIFERRLRSLTQKVPLSENTVNQIAASFNSVDASKVKIPNRTREAVTTALKRTVEVHPALSNAVTSAEAALASYLTGNSPEDLQAVLAARRLRAEATGKTFAFEPIATNTGPDNYQTTEISRQPNVARMERIDHPLPLASDYGPGFLVVQGLTATLDGYNLRRVIFRNTKVVYRGGPLILEQVYFIKCEFQLYPSPNTSKLLASLTSAGPISFSAA